MISLRNQELKVLLFSYKISFFKSITKHTSWQVKVSSNTCIWLKLGLDLEQLEVGFEDHQLLVALIG